MRTVLKFYVEPPLPMEVSLHEVVDPQRLKRCLLGETDLGIDACDPQLLLTKQLGWSLVHAQSGGLRFARRSGRQQIAQTHVTAALLYLEDLVYLRTKNAFRGKSRSKALGIKIIPPVVNKKGETKEKASPDKC